MPPGSARYWSWLFAAPDARDPLLGIYALTAEWRGLMDPATEPAVAHVKLAWWRDEIRRLIAGSPLHPVTRFIADMPSAASAPLTVLDRALEAATAQVAGVPLERAGEFESHAASLYGLPLLVAAQLAHPLRTGNAIQTCTTALAAGEYLSRAIADYRREARAGRIPFPVDALLRAEVDNEDLAAVIPPPRLQAYLDQLRLQAVGYFSAANRTLESSPCSDQRHLRVLATLGLKHLRGRKHPSSADFSVADLYNAWNAARRAAAAR